MTNLLSRYGFTRDSAWWLAGIIASVIVGIAAISESMWRTMGLPLVLIPYLSWFRLAALVVGIVSGKLSLSPLALSSTHELAGTKDPTQTLTLTGKLPTV